MPVPVSLTRWFASQYPTLHFSQEWLDECYAFLEQHHAGATAPFLLKKVEAQLLLSDLADSTVHHASLLPTNNGDSSVLFTEPKSGILVQVLEVLEIGRPALELLDIHKNRREDKKIGREVRRAVAHVEPTQNNGAEGTQQQQQNENAQAGNETPSRGFPRSMLRLKVSDGFNEYLAIESKRVPALSMEDTQLGTKLMLKNIRCLRGILMLDEQSCAVKGGQIADLESQKDDLLEQLLERRIKGDDDEGERPVQQRRANQRQPVPVARNQQARPPQPQVNRQQRPPPPRAPIPGPSRAANTRALANKKPKKEEEEDFDAMLEDDDDDDEEALAALQESEAVQSKQSQKPLGILANGSNVKGKGKQQTKAKVAKIEEDYEMEEDDDADLLAALEEAESSNKPLVKQQKQNTQLGFLTKASTRGRGGRHEEQKDAEIIDIDDSSSDAEVAAQIIAPTQSTQVKARATSNKARQAPIEID